MAASHCKLSLALLLLAAIPAVADPTWTETFPAYRIAGNLYYVGSKGLASFLVVTPAGNILINSDLESSPSLIRASVEKLGFRWRDTKILLISHAHYDHCAGSAEIKRETGAKYMVMGPDVPVVESGGAGDFQYGHDAAMRYAPAKVDRVLHDGDQVSLGGVVLTAHLTPGHTKGCTTWTLNVPDGGQTYRVVIVGSPNVNEGYKLVRNAQYPQIAQDYERCFRVLAALPCDIFLGAHGGYYGMEEKYARMKAGAKNAFVDPDGYARFVHEKEVAFRQELARQGGQ
jgi:metallo-beta-lactamase class B